MYEPEVYADINATRAVVNATVTTPYECAALVYREFPEANAAEYSNVGEGWCHAVFEA